MTLKKHRKYDLAKILDYVKQHGCVKSTIIPGIPRITARVLLEELAEAGLVNKYMVGRVAYYCAKDLPPLIDAVLNALCDVFHDINGNVRGGRVTIRVSDVAMRLGYAVRGGRGLKMAATYVAAVRHVMQSLPGVILVKDGKVTYVRETLEEICLGR